MRICIHVYRYAAAKVKCANLLRIHRSAYRSPHRILSYTNTLQHLTLTFGGRPAVTSHGGDNDGEIVAVITSGKDGIAETPLLTWGEYEIKETSVPEGYLDEGYTVRVRIPADKGN